MIYYLTSSPCLYDGRLNPINGFVSSIRRQLDGKSSCLFIASSAEDHILNDRFSKEMRTAFEKSGIYFRKFDVLDGRNKEKARELVSETEFIILAGGHVPTENRFFQSIGLRRMLKKYDGVLMGVSAGSMNAADQVYSQPELPGESVDFSYQRFFQGLGITSINILPHYNELKGSMLDDRFLYEDITMEDSPGHSFYVFVDGTYLSNVSGKEVIYGECYLIRDKKMIQVCTSGKELEIH